MCDFFMHRKWDICYGILFTTNEKGGAFMYSIKLPELNWFLYGNVYSGSLRTDPYKPCIGQTCFNYRVKAVESQKEKYLIAVCYFTLGWGKASNVEESIIGRFELSRFGIEVAENWIKSKFIVGGVSNDYILPESKLDTIEAPKPVHCLC